MAELVERLLTANASNLILVSEGLLALYREFSEETRASQWAGPPADRHEQLVVWLRGSYEREWDDYEAAAIPALADAWIEATTLRHPTGGRDD